MQAIVTKYLGPTNTRGSKIKATCKGGYCVVGYDDALSSLENHQKGVIRLSFKNVLGQPNFRLWHLAQR